MTRIYSNEDLSELVGLILGSIRELQADIREMKLKVSALSVRPFFVDGVDISPNKKEE